MAQTTNASALFNSTIFVQAIKDALAKLNPKTLARNPVIFVTEVVAALVTAFWLRDLIGKSGNAWFSGQIAAWLWFTVLFANFAEAVAEGRGKAQAESLRRTRTDTIAKRLLMPENNDRLFSKVSATALVPGDVVLVETNDLIPADGEVVEGIASVNESAITGESAPVIRESGGDRSAVTGGTTVLSDWIKVKITAAPGNTFIDRMIALVEGAERKKTPNELALSILLAGLTLIFLIAVVTLWGLAGYSGTTLSITVLVALLVTLIPTTIGGLLSAIGIAGMDRLIRFNVIATSGRAVEAAGDVDTLLLDKTGTITYGNRLATAFLSVSGVTEKQVAEAALFASLSDETPEGRSIVALCKGDYGLVEPNLSGTKTDVIQFSATTRISGIDVGDRKVRKGAVDAREQSDRHLFAGGGDDVQLARIRVRRQLVGELQQPVRFAAHCRDDDDNLVPLVLVALDALRDIPDALDRTDRRAAVFLDDQRHRQIFLKTSVLLVPPKPNAFESATSIFIGRAVSGT